MTGQGAAARVEVLAPARLHFGFIDLNGSLGRRFGSLGLTLDGIATELAFSPSDGPSAIGPSAERAVRYLESSAASLGLSPNVALTIRQAIPPHVGLGSGTQLGLAVAAGLARLNGLALPTEALAETTERGLRSGIGIGGFERGGFMVDGGRRGDGGTPPIIARLDFPAAWRLVLIFDRAMAGLHGEQERSAFATLPPMDEATADRLSRVLLIGILPGLADQDFSPVAAGLAEIQERIGDYFAAAQGGRFASAKVAGILAWLRGQGIVGVGQTSWGPTGFALIQSQEAAIGIEAALRRRFGGDATLDFQIVAGRNQGAEITTGPLRRTNEEP